MLKGYTIVVYRVEEHDDDPYFMAYLPDIPYFIAYLPDIGQAACSAVGETEQEAIDELGKVWEDVRSYYNEQGVEIPEPFTRIQKVFPE